MRLIDADALIKEAMKSPNYFIITYAVQKAPTIDAVPATLEDTLGYLHMIGWMQEHDKIMTENVKPVRHGKWVVLQQTSIPTIWNCKCSECGAYETKTSKYQANYCPNCGSKMDYDEWLANNDR